MYPEHMIKNHVYFITMLEELKERFKAIKKQSEIQDISLYHPVDGRIDSVRITYKNNVPSFYIHVSKFNHEEHWYIRRKDNSEYWLLFKLKETHITKSEQYQIMIKFLKEYLKYK